LQKDNSYLRAQQRAHERLLEGVTTKAARMPNGPWETVDPLDLTRVESAVSTRSTSEPCD
jgi:hypothetical protein